MILKKGRKEEKTKSQNKTNKQKLPTLSEDTTFASKLHESNSRDKVCLIRGLVAHTFNSSRGRSRGRRTCGFEVNLIYIVEF